VTADWSPPEGLDPSVRTVLLGGPLEPDAVNEAAARLMALDGLSAEPITLLVNSPGGGLGEVTALLDVLDLVRAPVTVTVVGRAHGTAGALAAASPGRRTAGARATLSLRCGAEAEHQGTVTELSRHAEGLRLVLDGLADRVARRSGRPRSWVADQLTNGTVHPAPQAVDLGLLDGLATPGASGGPAV
jgi:ATP-dependent Clp protease, protease subunit